VGIVPSLVTERIESVKAGIVGAGAFTVVELLLLLARSILANTMTKYDLPATTIDWQLLMQIGIGMVSGFLFGVTYRYVIRNDQNSHLKDGAVLAFGLVRGLALIENNLILSEFLFAMILIVQSIICFALTRFVLDLAIARKLLKPFT